MSKEKVHGFVITEERTTYNWPVSFTPPGSDKTHVVELTFHSCGFDELKAFEAAAKDDEEEVANLACEVVAGWPQSGDKTFKTPDGGYVPVNEENKRAIFDRIYLARQTMEAFFQSQGGKKRR